MLSKILSIFKKPQEQKSAPHPLDGPTKKAVLEPELPLVQLEQYQKPEEVVQEQTPATAAVQEPAPAKKGRKKGSPSQKSKKK